MQQNKFSPLVSIVIVTYSGKMWLSACLKSILRQNYHNLEIILVDNASPEKISSFVKSKFPKVKIINRTINDGLSSALNAGISKSRGKYVLVSNEDMELTPQYVSELVKLMEKDSSIGCVQGLVYDYHKRNELQSCGVLFSLTGRLKSAVVRHPELLSRTNTIFEKSLATPFTVFSVKGPGFLIRRDIFDKIGGFDSDYFLYWEEIDLCWRIWLAGFRVVVIPLTQLYHVSSGSTAVFPYEFLYMHSLKNQLTTYVKNSSPLKLLVSLTIQLFLSLGSIIIFLAKGKIRLALAVVAGWYKFLGSIESIVGKRRKNSSYKLIS